MDQFLNKALESLLTGGVPGTILAFILWKIAPAVSKFRDDIVAALRRLEEAVDRRARADLIRLATDPMVSEKLKDAAREILQEIDNAEKARALPAPEAKGKP